MIRNSFSFISLSKYLCAHIGQIQIVDGRHRCSFGQRIQMFRVFGQQTFRLIDAIAITGHWCRRFALGLHSMNVTESRIVPNVVIAATLSGDFLFAFLFRFGTNVRASPNGILIADGVRVIDVILHGQIRWGIDEEGEYC